MAIDIVSASARGILVFLNVISAFLALAVMVVGVDGILKADELNEYSHLLEKLGLRELCVTMLMVGIIMSGLSAMGIAAAFFKWKKLLTVYTMLTFLGAITEISLGSFVTDAARPEFLDEVVGDERWGYQSPLARLHFQDSLECCGWPTVRISGCRTRQWTCKAALASYIEENIVPLGETSIGVGVLQLLSLLVSCFVIFQHSDTKDDFFTNAFAY